MISNGLLEEIIDISLKGNYINKTIIMKVFDEVFINLDNCTKEIFNDLQFGSIERNTATTGICYIELGIIKLDLINSYIYENKNKYTSMLVKNLNIIIGLLHEIEHLKEPSKMLKGNFESKLLKCSMESNDELYEELYNYIPAEKIANANSCELMLKNISKYPQFEYKYFDEFKYINNKYIRNLKLGYCYDEFLEQYNIPLFYYLLNTNQIDVLLELGTWKSKSLSKSINFSSSELKLKYGLPITNSDIEQINRRKILRYRY